MLQQALDSAPADHPLCLQMVFEIQGLQYSSSSREQSFAFLDSETAVTRLASPYDGVGIAARVESLQLTAKAYSSRGFRGCAVEDCNVATRLLEKAIEILPETGAEEMRKRLMLDIAYCAMEKFSLSQSLQDYEKAKKRAEDLIPFDKEDASIILYQARWRLNMSHQYPR